METAGWLGHLLVVGLVLVGAVGVASAHDSQTVNGYELTFGGADEPVITGERMWLEVQIVEAETAEPVVDIEDDLTMAVQEPFGDQTKELDVSSRFGEPGWYEAAVIFTRPGTYTVYLHGSVDGTAIDASFQTQVHNASTLEYPAPTTGSDPSGGLGAATGFGMGALIAAVGMVAAYAVGRRTGG